MTMCVIIQWQVLNIAPMCTVYVLVTSVDSGLITMMSPLLGSQLKYPGAE